MVRHDQGAHNTIGNYGKIGMARCQTGCGVYNSTITDGGAPRLGFAAWGGILVDRGHGGGHGLIASTGGDDVLLSKIIGIVALIALPVSISLWVASHRNPIWRRYDVTLYKSLKVNLSEGVCGLELLSMPRKVASRTQFSSPLKRTAVPSGRTLLFDTKKNGAYRTTRLVFPLWTSTLALLLTGITPFLVKPLIRWRRERNGWCIHCGYNLTGNRTGRCSECGTRFRRATRR